MASGMGGGPKAGMKFEQVHRGWENGPGLNKSIVLNRKKKFGIREIKSMAKLKKNSWNE